MQTSSSITNSQNFSSSQARTVSTKYLLHAGLGGVAGLFMEGVPHPIDTIRTRIKTNTRETISMTAQTRAMFRREGVLSYFRGFTCTIVGSFVVNASYYYVYEKLKDSFYQKGLLSQEAAPFAAAFVGGLLSNFASLPFDVVRTRMQLSPGSYDYRNFLDGALKVLKNEGPRKLYLGGTAFFALTAVETSLTFGFYELFYKAFKPFFHSSYDVNIPLSMACGTGAAAFAGFLSNPLDVLVTRLQSVDTKSKGSLTLTALIRNIYRNEGLEGFMKGVTSTMWYYALGALLLFPTYEVLKSAYNVDLSK